MRSLCPHRDIAKWLSNFGNAVSLSSTSFKFLVGPEKKLFTVHSALVTHHSKPLGVLVNGDMSEAKEGCALLEETDEHTLFDSVNKHTRGTMLLRIQKFCWTPLQSRPRTLLQMRLSRIRSRVMLKKCVLLLIILTPNPCRSLLR